MGFIATIALKDLGVEVAFSVSGHVNPLNATGSGDQIMGVEAIAIAFALRVAFSPSHADERIKLLTHHVLHHHANATAGQFTQILSERLLVRQRWDGLLLALRQAGAEWYPSCDDEQA